MLLSAFVCMYCFCSRWLCVFVCEMLCGIAWLAVFVCAFVSDVLWWDLSCDVMWCVCSRLWGHVFVV